MNLLRRKTPSADSSATAAETSDADVATTGKGRPTPKRQTTAQPLPPAPRTRKEAVAWQKQTGTRAKVGGQRKMTNAEYRQAMKSGDARVLPRRDAGPVKLLARNYVDTRRMASNYLLWLFPLFVLGSAFKPLTFLTLVLFLLIVLEWIYTGRKLRSLALSRGHTVSGSPFALGFYAGSRAYFPRSWRRPAPTLKRGDEI